MLSKNDQFIADGFDQARLVPECVLDNIMELARIDAADRTGFHASVRGTVGCLWSAENIRAKGRKVAGGALRKAASAAMELNKALLQLRPDETEHLQSHFAILPELEYYTCTSVDELMWMALNLDAFLNFAAGNSAVGASKTFGQAEHFVLLFYENVQQFGGRIGVQKNAGKGRLLDAIQLLKPYLPPNFHMPSASTLERIVHSARTGARPGTDGFPHPKK
jgi:hypothetical protein